MKVKEKNKSAFDIKKNNMSPCHVTLFKHKLPKAERTKIFLKDLVALAHKQSYSFKQEKQNNKKLARKCITHFLRKNIK